MLRDILEVEGKEGERGVFVETQGQLTKKRTAIEEEEMKMTR